MMSGGTMDVNQFSVPGSMAMPPQNIPSYGQPSPLLNDPPAAIQERTKKRLDKYRENAKRKESGHDHQVNHLLVKDLKETEKYHQKVNELKTKRKSGRDRKDNEKNSNGLRPDEQNAIMKGIRENMKENKRMSRKANSLVFGAGQSKGHVATAPVVAHPMFQSQVTPTPFGLVDNEIQLKLDPDRLNSFSDLKQDDIVAILGSQSMANQSENHAHTSAHAAGHIGPSALSDNFLQQQGGATGDGSIKQEHSSGSPLYHDMQPSMSHAQSSSYHPSVSQSFAAAHQQAAAARWGYGATQMTYQTSTQHAVDPRFLGQQMIHQQQHFPNHSSAYQYPQGDYPYPM
ncbi:Oidioi.mRNA.OKI2018_I69.PAR.g11893.t1.cds [Oikopleura dioica]|uniref:Oidioi.mRNA.OKI2018_I69.PAR.g11893.t1.cds n=1 Tax=Oikopleura dioica TaxID=34765 RepID=A0ABN7S249_OIKDI|nr:Oidioi.mRNA.OKI2018_I69.PAR.g11893.t1.cds [Oikopleura dioica]